MRYEDTAALVKIPGVGKKTAERLIIEMRDQYQTRAGTPGRAPRVRAEGNARSEAVDALVALGYKATK